MRATVVLDRDYRTDEDVKEVLERLNAVGVVGHVWQANELENYLIKAPVIARVSQAPLADVETFIRTSVQAMEPDFLAGVTTHLLKKAKRARQPEEVAIRKGQELGRRLWAADKSKRVLRVAGKQLLSAINGKLQAAAYSPVAARGLAQRMRAAEIDPEVQSFLRDIERELNLTHSGATRS